MKKGNTTIIGIIAVIVIAIAGYFIFKSGSGTQSSNGIVIPGDPKKTDPNFDPMRNAPPGMTGAGKGG